MPDYRHHKTIRWKVIKSFSSAFTGKMLKSIKKTLVAENSYVISLLVLYTNINTMMYKVIGTVIYCFYG